MELADYGLHLSDLTELRRLFEHATTFGSLIQIPETLAAQLPALKQLSELTSQDLFLSNALKRLALLVRQAELLAAQYDAVVANPPYMGSKFHIPILKKFLKDHYKGYEKDVFSAFINRDLAFSKPHGRLGFMSPFVWMFISSHEHLRTRIIDKETITSLIQLEYSGFEGATVPICTFTLQKGHVYSQKGCFVRLSDFRGPDSQAPKTLEAIRDRNCGWFFEATQDEFKKIPDSPVAYWVSDAARKSFVDSSTVGDLYTITCGLFTCDNGRFIRKWWEVSLANTNLLSSTKEPKWLTHIKGGSGRKWSSSIDDVVNFGENGTEIREFRRGRGQSYSLPGEKHYFSEGIALPLVSSSTFAARQFSQRSTFDISANSAFEISHPLLVLLGFLCSRVGTNLLSCLCPTLNFSPGDVAKLPIVTMVFEQFEEEVIRISGECIKICIEDEVTQQTSFLFRYDPLLDPASSRKTISFGWEANGLRHRERVVKMKRLEEENNRLFIDAYGLADELTPDVPIEQITLTVNPAYRYGSKLTEEEQWTRFRQDTMAELVSYAIGCMMGRYSLDAPGLIYAHSGNVGFDAARYTTFPADSDGIIPLTQNEWFEDDAAHRLVKFISVAWDAGHLEENLTFLANNLSPKKNESSRETLRRYLCDSFFKDHLQTYKKRPIYWLFSSGKQKAFQCLVYLHRYNEGTLARMRTEYVIPLQGMMASRVRQLEEDIVAATSTVHRKRLEKERATLVKQQAELREFDEKLRHYADQRIGLDLDDGVKVNYGKFGDLLAEVKAVTGNNTGV